MIRTGRQASTETAECLRAAGLDYHVLYVRSRMIHRPPPGYVETHVWLRPGDPWATDRVRLAMACLPGALRTQVGTGGAGLRPERDAEHLTRVVVRRRFRPNTEVERIVTPQQLADLALRLRVRQDWNDTAAQGVSAVVVGEGCPLDNTTGPDPDGKYEPNVVITHHGQPEAVVNLADLLAWAAAADRPDPRG